MATIAERFIERNRQLGALLADARRSQNRSISECAAAIATSRRRYNAIERGTASISAVELEVLVEYFRLSVYDVWGNIPDDPSARHLVVLPGETVIIRVESSC